MKKRKLLKRIQKLERRVAELEARPRVSFTPYDKFKEFKHASPTVVPTSVDPYRAGDFFVPSVTISGLSRHNH